MNPQRISLTRIIAVNWYGFRQIIDVTDDILISGAYGSGKSALLDLIQYVLLGEHWRANRAAAGRGRGRSLVSYCLCDSNTLRDGEPHYIRRNGVTLVALEFTKPATGRSEAQRETWGIRIEYESATSQPKQTYFGVPDRLEWAVFAPDGSLLGDEEFRTVIRREYGKECLHPRQRDYLAEMATPKHLYFDREQMNRTMPKALAFEPEDNVEKFIREYILEDGPIDVREVKIAVSAYRDTQARLEKQEDEAGYLRRICEHHAAYLAAQRDEKLWAHLRIAVEEVRLREAVEKHQRELERLNAANAADNTAFDVAVRAKDQLAKSLDELLLEASADPDQAKLKSATDERREKLREINDLRDAQKSVRERLRGRAQSWVGWLKQAASLRLDGLSEVLTIDDALLAALRSGDEKAGGEALGKLAERFQEIFRSVEALLRRVENAAETAAARVRELARDLEMLDENRTPGAFPLFNAIKTRLVSSATPPEQLCRLIEVRPEAEDDDWREALELFLGRNRFAVIVSPGDYKIALDILQRTPLGREPESLVHPREAMEMSATVKPRSLGEKVEVTHDVARRFVAHLLGGVICVDDVPDLDGHERAITRRGIFKQVPLRRKLKQIPGFEFTLGREGLKRLRENALREQKAQMAVRDQQEGLVTSVHAWLDSGKKTGLADSRLPDRAGELVRLPDIEAAADRLKERIAMLSTPEREARLEMLCKLQGDLAGANQRIGELKQARTQFETDTRREQEALGTAETALADTSRALGVNRAELPSDLIAAVVKEALDALFAELASWKERADGAENREGQARDRASKCRTERDKVRLALATDTNARGEVKHPEYKHDFPADEDSNEHWAARLKTLDETELEKYRALADEKRRDWEQRLQSQVLDRINDNLRTAEKTVRQLKSYLDRDVGQHRYRISQQREPACAALWHLLDTGLEPTDPLAQGIKTDEIQRAKAELMVAVEAAGKDADERSQRLLDYRYYHRYDLHMVPIDRLDGPAIAFGRSAQNLSGGENQVPFFISMLAAFRRVYDLGGGQYRQNLGLVVMDEAFSKTSGDGVEDCLEIARNFNLQLLMAFPIDRLGVMAPYAQTVILCRKEMGERDAAGYASQIHNIPTVLTSEQVEESLA